MCKFIPVVFLLLLCIQNSVKAGAEDVKPFFDTLESTLHQQYLFCTGDSSYKSRAEILVWKKKIEMFAESDSFAQISKTFFSETGLSPSDVYICELINWYESRTYGDKDYIKLIADDIRKREQRKADSQLISNIHKEAEISPFDFAGIPFGISKKWFQMIMEWKFSKKYTDQGKWLQYNGLMIDKVSVNAAFHFDKEGNYRMYELECEEGPLDSLNTKVRNDVAVLGSIIEGSCGMAPDHIYRIGRFDITQGHLTVERLWNTKQISAFVGIATYHYKYYGKAVVVAKEIKKISSSEVKTNEKSGD
jgi:hypothetical protein